MVLANDEEGQGVLALQTFGLQMLFVPVRGNLFGLLICHALCSRSWLLPRRARLDETVGALIRADHAGVLVGGCLCRPALLSGAARLFMQNLWDKRLAGVDIGRRSCWG